MSYDEISRIIINKVPVKNADALLVYAYKAKLFADALPLYKYLCDKSPNRRLSSEEVSDAWLFFQRGTELKHAFEHVFDDNAATMLLEASKSSNLPAIKMDLDECLKLGPFLSHMYAIAWSTETRIEGYYKMWKDVFSGDDDPIRWYYRNGETTKCRMPTTDLDRETLRLRRSISLTTDKVFDPILQD